MPLPGPFLSFFISKKKKVSLDQWNSSDKKNKNKPKNEQCLHFSKYVWFPCFFLSSSANKTYWVLMKCLAISYLLQSSHKSYLIDIMSCLYWSSPLQEEFLSDWNGDKERDRESEKDHHTEPSFSAVGTSLESRLCSSHWYDWHYFIIRGTGLE